ncbi:hypothetical protein MYX78_00540 [Acidobacteria bacterium AH-259-G07]|nr:hypothetical protein [Acidobacteria bacterium AH-259-G07]
MKELDLVTYGLYPSVKGPDSSVKNLALAILRQAFRDAFASPRNSRNESWRKDALEWFFSQEDCPGSLDWVCEILQIDAGSFREWLQIQTRSAGKTAMVNGLSLRRWVRILNPPAACAIGKTHSQEQRAAS